MRKSCGFLSKQCKHLDTLHERGDSKTPVGSFPPLVGHISLSGHRSVDGSCPSVLLVPGHGLWMFQYGVKRPVFDVLSPQGTDLSPIMSAIYLFLTMIIVFQVRNRAILNVTTGSDSGINKASSVAEFETVLSRCCKPKRWRLLQEWVCVTSRFLSPRLFRNGEWEKCLHRATR